MKSKRGQIERIIDRFAQGYSRDRTVEDILNIFYPTSIDVFDLMNPKFKKTGLMLVSAEKEALAWTEVDPALGSMDLVPYLFNYKAFVALDGDYFGNIVRVEISADEAMDNKIDVIADLMIQKIRSGQFA